MKCSLDGLMKNAGDAARSGDEMYGGTYAYSLEELAKNLRELRNRTFAGDLTALDEFFSLYVFSEPPTCERRLTIEERMREASEWANVTFPAATQASRAEHLRREACELCSNPNDAEEMADVASLLGHLANCAGVDLAAAMGAKLEKNRLRNWATPDAKGVSEHVRDVLTRGLRAEAENLDEELIVPERITAEEADHLLRRKEENGRMFLNAFSDQFPIERKIFSKLAAISAPLRAVRRPPLDPTLEHPIDNQWLYAMGGRNQGRDYPNAYYIFRDAYGVAKLSVWRRLGGIFWADLGEPDVGARWANDLSTRADVVDLLRALRLPLAADGEISQ